MPDLYWVVVLAAIVLLLAGVGRRGGVHMPAPPKGPRPRPTVPPAVSLGVDHSTHEHTPRGVCTLRPKQKEIVVDTEQKVSLGDRVQDTITGFAGVAIAISEYLWGCRRIGIQSEKLDKDGKPFETQWIDEPQLSVTGTTGAVGTATGGPKDEPRRAADPE